MPGKGADMSPQTAILPGIRDPCIHDTSGMQSVRMWSAINLPDASTTMRRVVSRTAGQAGGGWTYRCTDTSLHEMCGGQTRYIGRAACSCIDGRTSCVCFGTAEGQDAAQSVAVPYEAVTLGSPARHAHRSDCGRGSNHGDAPRCVIMAPNVVSCHGICLWHGGSRVG